MKTAIVIPAYNCESTIGTMVDKCLKFCNMVIVVDNNSQDNTFLTALKHKALVIKESKQGQGAATRTGWQTAASLNCNVIITLDADGQHNPDEILSLIEPIKNNQADIVIGSRFINRFNAPKYRKFGIDIINWICNVFQDIKFIDTQSCYRVYNKKALTRLKIEEDGFGFSTELLIKARKYRLRIIEVPVSCIYHRSRKCNSTLNPLKHGIIVAWKTLYWRMKLWDCLFLLQ